MHYAAGCAAALEKLGAISPHMRGVLGKNLPAFEHWKSMYNVNQAQAPLQLRPAEQQARTRLRAVADKYPLSGGRYEVYDETLPKELRSKHPERYGTSAPKHLSVSETEMKKLRELAAQEQRRVHKQMFTELGATSPEPLPRKRLTKAPPPPKTPWPPVKPTVPDTRLMPNVELGNAPTAIRQATSVGTAAEAPRALAVERAVSKTPPRALSLLRRLAKAV